VNIFESTKLEFRRKIFVLAGAKIDVADQQSGTGVGFVKMKAFKLKEDIRLFADETKTQELLTIQARQIIDFGATYDVSDPQSGSKLFSLQRKGLRSTFVRDKWLILDSQGNEYGYYEEVGVLALIRRYTGWIPFFGGLVEFVFFFLSIDYELYVTTSGQPQLAAIMTRHKNPFVVKYETDATVGDTNVDNRMIVAATTMLTIIEVSKN
jgi:hypothetical protein